MASKRTPALELGEKLCAALRAQRDRGPESYPLSLQRLVELADPHAEPALVDKAVAGKPFKDTALVAQKNNRAAPVALAEDLEKLAASPRLLEFVLDQLCSPGSPTCAPGKLKAKVVAPLKKPFEEAVTRQLRENRLPPTVGSRLERNRPVLFLHRLPPPPPPRDPVEVLAEKLLRALMSQRALGGDAYPLPLRRLVELADPGAATATVKKACAHPALQPRAAFVDSKKPEAPVALAEDGGRLVSSRCFLEYLLRAKRKADQQAFPVEGLLARKSEFYRPFVEAVRAQIDTGTLPPTVGWMWVGKKKQVFFLDDVHGSRAAPPPAPPLPPEDFAAAFAAAFERIDRQNGAHNFVSLVDLRRQLPTPRERFDAGLRRLRIDGRYTLSAAEGRHGVSPEEHAAGIVEDGALLLYVSRKTHTLAPPLTSCAAPAQEPRTK